jgi:hypothetical protein
VAQNHRAHAEVEVDQAIAVNIYQNGAFRVVEGEGRGGDTESEVAADTASQILLRPLNEIAGAYKLVGVRDDGFLLLQSQQTIGQRDSG